MPMSSNSAQSNQTLHPKLLAITIALVIGLHIGVGIGLMNMPAFTVKPINVTPPLEVKFMALPKPSEPKPIVQSNPEPQIKTTRHTQQEAIPKKVTLQPMPKTEPKHVTEKIEKVEKPIQPTAKPEKPVTKQAKPMSEPKLAEPVTQHIEPQTIAAQQAEQAEQITQQQAQLERAEQARQAALREQADNERRAEIARQQAQAEQQKNDEARIAKEQAERQRLAQEKLAKEQADKEQAEQERLEKQQAEKAAQAKKAADNNQPVQFGNGDAAWRSKPNLSFSGNLARIINEEHLNSLSVRLNVNSSGNITSVVIIRSSGNSQVDNAVKQRLFSAKLKPFIRNGVAVDGIGNLTVNLN